jgi:prepilin-type N-terminal cleavage/methylation domain-containing protein
VVKATRAFTLLELLIVIAIISILSGAIFAVIPMIRFRAAALDTTHRIEQILTAVGTYGRDNGSAAQSLQEAAGLGGVIKFDSMEVISQVLKAGGAGRNLPMFLQRPDGSGRFWGVWTDPYVWTFVPPSTSDPYHPNSDEDAQQRPKWKEVMDVLPPLSGTVDKSFYETVWPSSWPDTDWNAPAPGTKPPILRFPWGRPGLTLDGGPCDPSKPTTAIFRRVIEWKNHATFCDDKYIYGGQTAWSLNRVGDTPYLDNVPVANCWVTYPPSGASTMIDITLDAAFLTTGSQQTAPLVSPVTGHRSDGSTVTVEANQPLPFDLGLLSPLSTVDLLKLAGTLDATTGEHDYRTDRNPRRLWNDAWGNPLVISFAIFQPERFQRVCDGQNRRDLLLKKAYDAYGYNRSVYLAAGAIGPDRGALRPSIDALAASGSAAEDRVALAAIWKQIGANCDAVSWTEAGFSAPPWKGVKLGRKNGMRSFLSTPSEVR